MHSTQAVLGLPAKQVVREFIMPASQYALVCFSDRLVEVGQQDWCFFVSLFNCWTFDIVNRTL